MREIAEESRYQDRWIEFNVLLDLLEDTDIIHPLIDLARRGDEIAIIIITAEVQYPTGGP